MPRPPCRCSNRGYTIDQTVLIVAIIAILITIIVITVGWQLLGRSSGTKASSVIKQTEESVGQFYGDHHVWPYLALTGTPTPEQLALTLVNGTSLAALWDTASIATDRIRNYMPGLSTDGSILHHPFGGGDGVISLQANRVPASLGIGDGMRIVLQFTDVPRSEAEEADLNIDASATYNAGRLIYGDSACLNATMHADMIVPASAPQNSSVFVCYAANAL